METTYIFAPPLFLSHSGLYVALATIFSAVMGLSAAGIVKTF